VRVWTLEVNCLLQGIDPATLNRRYQVTRTSSRTELAIEDLGHGRTVFGGRLFPLRQQRHVYKLPG